MMPLPIAQSESTPGSSSIRRAGGLILPLIIFVALAGAVVLAATRHFVKTGEGLRTYPKASIGLKDTYVDLTTMKYGELGQHTEVIDAMVKAGDWRFLPGGELWKVLQDGKHSTAEVLQSVQSQLEMADKLEGIAQKGAEKLQRLKDVGKQAKEDLEKAAGEVKKILGK